MFLEDLQWLSVNAVRSASVWLAFLVLAGCCGKNLGQVASIEEELTLAQMLWGSLVLTYRDGYIFAVTFFSFLIELLKYAKQEWQQCHFAQLSFSSFDFFGAR